MVSRTLAGKELCQLLTKIKRLFVISHAVKHLNLDSSARGLYPFKHADEGDDACTHANYQKLLTLSFDW